MGAVFSDFFSDFDYLKRYSFFGNLLNKVVVKRASYRTGLTAVLFSLGGFSKRFFLLLVSTLRRSLEKRGKTSEWRMERSCPPPCREDEVAAPYKMAGGRGGGYLFLEKKARL